MSKDKIAGKYNNKHIYYHDDSTEYYKVNVECEALDENEVLALKVAQSFKKNHDRKMRKKILKASLITLASLALTGGVVHKMVTDNANEIEYCLFLNSDLPKENEMLVYLVDSLETNSTCSEEIRDELYKYLEVISRYDLDTSTLFRLGKRLAKYDFSNFSGTNFAYYKTIDEILDLDDESLITQHLYAYINNVDVDYNRFISTLIQDDKDIVNELLNGKSLEKILKEKYSLQINFQTMSVDEIEKNVKNKIMDLHSNTMNGINDYKVVLLASDIFGGNFIVRNNLFSEYICVSYNNEYDLYFQDGDNVSNLVYYDKLANNLSRDLTSLDPKNQEDRFLIYLYTSMYYAYNNKTENLVDYLYPSGDIFDIDKEFVYKYYTNGIIDYSYLFDQISDLFIFASSDNNTPEETERSFKVMELLFSALKEDLNDGLISKETYDDLIITCDNYLNKFNYYKKREDFMERWYAIRDSLNSNLKLNLENKSIY